LALLRQSGQQLLVIAGERPAVATHQSVRSITAEMNSASGIVQRLVYQVVFSTAMRQPRMSCACRMRSLTRSTWAGLHSTGNKS
jgi:hypothetical protein